ncbi:hypothetical protein C5F48_06665 [Cereibacter changlensis JA139]|uniref:DUF982 domain-containing protein n=2 Tax=Cereibacter changlensis TaxID=402884 RepID=A0A2T4JXN9_9RHOB|nr:DUF982 domain-containing protein [Cereibacter changlensis]PTE22523.1 hypothetical protein C5F48_06665 [Cereibacter changlensis JA139]
MAESSVGGSMVWSRLDWHTPVFLNLPGAADPEPILAVDEASEFLANRWPAEKTAVYWEAANLCRRCIHGQVGPLEARDALVAAAEEAGIHMAA